MSRHTHANTGHENPEIEQFAENPEPEINNLEKIVWYDINVNNIENTKYQTKLKIAFESFELNTFKDMDSFREFVKKLDKRAILIVSGSSHEEVFEFCYESKHFTDIIIFAFNSNKYDHLTKYGKIYKVCISINDVEKSIQEILIKN